MMEVTTPVGPASAAQYRSCGLEECLVKPFLLPVCLIVACAPPTAGFTPSETITPDNLGRLEEVFSWDAESPPRKPSSPFLCALENCGLDGASGMLYAHRYRRSGLRSLLPVGIDCINLARGALVRTARIPAKLDMSGSAHNGEGESAFDYAHNQAFMATRFEV